MGIAFAIGKFMLGGFQWIKKAISALLSFVKEYPVHAALLASLIACAVLWRANERHKDERDRAIATIERMIEAQKKATAFAVRMKKAFENSNRRINDETDKSAADQRIVYRERVLRLPAPSCATGNANLPESGVPEGVNRSSPEAVVPRSDLLICADNQARLEAANAWALKMQALQDAIPEQ